MMMMYIDNSDFFYVFNKIQGETANTYITNTYIINTYITNTCISNICINKSTK